MPTFHPLPLLLSFLTATAIAAPCETTSPFQVQTSSGLVRGHNASWPQGTSVVEFLGIPYAQPPLGELRFAAPQAYQTNQSQLFVADKYSQDCLQYTGSAGSATPSPALLAYGYGMGGGSPSSPHSYGEDCLTMNIWTKPTGDTKKAVMLWVYGGAFTTGTSNAPFYNGGRLAQDEDVVFASFNYRINIFGFSHAPGLDQNVGLLDQRLAVEWVRDNIAGFGGDPERITLLGESAGGSSVDLYSYAWTQEPIVNGFIEESGTSLLISGSQAMDYTPWYNVSSLVGCGGSGAGNQTNQTVECMRNVSATDIINAVGQLPQSGITSGFTPAPDGKIVFADYKNRSAAGNFIQRPLLGGTNDFEVGILRGIGGGTPFTIPGIDSANITDDQIEATTAIAFGCPAGSTAKDRSNFVPTWRYRYMAVWDNVALAPGMGAYHSSEIPIALGTNPLRPNVSADVPEEAALERVMVHAWAEFAKDPDGGLLKLGWPKYNVSGNTLIRLGYNNQSTLNFANSTLYDTSCGAFGY